MKCPKTRPPLRSVSGKELRPERTCDETLYDIRADGVGSCPFHGLVEIPVVDDLTGKQQEIMDDIVAKANGKKKRKGKKAKKDKRRG